LMTLQLRWRKVAASNTAERECYCVCKKNAVSGQ
jgi:hypothetical protein